jgi:dynein heavy chain, axonemal
MLRPGLITLTWTSMNIDSFLNHIQKGYEYKILSKFILFKRFLYNFLLLLFFLHFAYRIRSLEELITSVNDIIKYRIENNLASIANVILVHLSSDRRCSLDEYEVLL